MAVTLVSARCPQCGAELKLDESQEQALCPYCGTKVLLRNENEHIYRHIDEARMKELELEEKRREDAEKTKMLKIRISLVLGVIGVIMLLVGYLGGHASGRLDSPFYIVALIGLVPLMAAGYIWLLSGRQGR